MASSGCVTMVLLGILLTFFPGLNGQRYTVDTFTRTYPARDPKGENGYDRGVSPSDCSQQCRCIALNHLGYKDMAERWFSMGGRADEDSTIIKRTEASVWKEDSEKIHGRDVVCMGLNKIPRPLPHSTVKLTLFGDSSNVTSDSNSNTQITYIRDNSFMNTDSLRQLTISGNNIYILYPYIFRGLKNLRHLALQNNNISHISAASFSTLEYLVELRLSDNMIRFLSPDVFSQLVNLEYLYLNGNKLSAINAHVLRKLINLKHIDLSRNNFRTFSDSAFDGLINLEEMLMNENQIASINSRWLQNLSKQRNLEIRANSITRIDPGSFDAMTNLEQLSLSANGINVISNEAFRNLSKLNTLDIGTNDIGSLEPDCFAGLDALDELDLSSNRLSFINNRTFTATPILRSLDLSKNSITDIQEAALHPLASLQKLDISFNKMKAVKSKTLTGLMELKEVNLEHNLISKVENDAFIVAPLNQLSKITWLSLQFNKIRSLSSYSLYGLPQVKFLNIGHNRLKTINIKSFYTLSSLQHLLLNDNHLNVIEDGLFTNLKQLIELNLAMNKLSAISDNTFVGLRNLETLDCSSNGIESLSPNAFRHFSKLKRLELKGNLLLTFSFSDMLLVKELTHVDLSNNILYEVGFPNEHTHDVQHIDLSMNQLQTLPSDVTNVLASTGNIVLRSNPWSCDCRLEWLSRYASQYKLRILESRGTVCKSPSTSYGMKITDVASHNFRCDNTTVSNSITCHNPPVRFTRQERPIHDGQGRQEAGKWHVEFKGNHSNKTEVCNGLLLHQNWVLTRRVCAEMFLPSNYSDIIVAIGKGDSRAVALHVDYITNTDAANYDFRLVRLVSKRRALSRKDNSPCILTHTQYHQLSHALPEGIFTTRLYHKESQQWRLSVKTGEILLKCGGNGDICVKPKHTLQNGSQHGSPLSMRYQGVWYLAGLGSMVNDYDTKYQKFTPLWAVKDWIASVIHEIDNKCTFQTKKGNPLVLCEGLRLKGVLTVYSGKVFK